MTLPTDKTWKFYGRNAPYFGVFGQAEFLNDHLDNDKLDYFFQSGNQYVDHLFQTIHKIFSPRFKPATILDFGCGPGRMMIPFAKIAGMVTGMDISSEMLEEARKNCQGQSINNTRFLMADDNLKLIENQRFDLVHSFIVLQHLHTKRGVKLFLKLIEKINKDGIGVIHFTYHDHFPLRRSLNFFRFRIPYFANLLRTFRSDNVKRNLKARPQMQMNSYDLNLIFSILQEKNIKQVYSEFSDHHQYWGITVYFRMD